MGWPCDWRTPKKITGAVLVEIVWNLPRYARDAAYYSGEIFPTGGPLYSGFKVYCRCVKNYLHQVVYEAPNSTRAELSGIAEEGFGLIDTLLEWVKGRLQPLRDDEGYVYWNVPCSFDELERRWDTLVRKFDLCMSSGVKNGQKEKEDIAGPGQVNSGNSLELDLNNFNKRSKGSYVLLLDLLGDKKREGVTLNESRHGKKQPKELKDVLSDHGLKDLRKEICEMKNGKIKFKIPHEQIFVTYKKTK